MIGPFSLRLIHEREGCSTVSQLETEYVNADDGGNTEALDYLPEEIRHLILTELSVSPPIAGRAFGLGVSSAYRAVRKTDPVDQDWRQVRGADRVDPATAWP
jgi:hypothetical protein